MNTLAQRNARRAAEVRNNEAADALHFVVYGHDEHVGRCMFAEDGEPCSRTYDPMPYPEAAPTPSLMYAGTGIGALYGLPGSERHLWQLAGWNVDVIIDRDPGDETEAEDAD